MELKRVVTKDGSITYHNPKYDETYHTKAGAIAEALVKYVQPCNLDELAKKQKEIHILDVCFGLGYNSLMAIHVIKETNPDCKIMIYVLENDKEIISKIPGLDINMPEFTIIKDFAEWVIESSGKHLHYNKGDISIDLMLGDARDEIKKMAKNKIRFDCVLFDPFSPKKCPELWTEEFFKDIRLVCKESTVLTTYSCARIVRENLYKAGFKVKDGPVFGRKSPATVAYLSQTLRG